MSTAGTFACRGLSAFRKNELRPTGLSTGCGLGYKLTMKTLPGSVNAYKKTPIFDETTVPSGLLKDHHTKASVWAKIVVLSGILEYRVEGPQPQVYVLTDTNPGVVEPMLVHSIKPKGETRFYVEFYK